MIPTLLDLNNWLKEKDEAHDLVKSSATKIKNEDTTNSLTGTIFASNAFAAKTEQKSHQSKEDF